MDNQFAIISRLIREQLLLHNRLSLPGLGSFLAEDQPSMITDDGRLVRPPGRTISFSVKEIWNDEILERAYAAELEETMLELDDVSLDQEEGEGLKNDSSTLFIDQAKRDVSKFVSAIELQLQTSGFYVIPDLGTLKMAGKRREVSFTQLPESDFAPQAFGLSPLSIKPLPSPSRLQKSIPRVDNLHQSAKPPKTKKHKKHLKSWILSSLPKWLLLLLGILLLFLLLCFLIYLFRAELKPFLEWLLLSPWERGI